VRIVILLLSLMVGTATQAAESDFVSFVERGADGVAFVRVITEAKSCPAIAIDGHEQAMAVRAPAGSEPLRPTGSTPAKSKPSVFSVTSCEATLPAGAQSASILGRALPLPKPRTDRIVVIGDTGCRIKGKEVQPCNDVNKYPFAKIAALAAAWKPDLVLHVGDYQYRENECPASEPGCSESPWGYGWDTWNADFFAPAQPLLRAAPWVLVRGNHENCFRAGQGWMRFIDPNPWTPERNCNDPAHDLTGDDSPVFAVPLGDGAQIVAMDLAFADESRPLDAADPHAAPIIAAYHRIDELSRNATFTFLATHKPILGLSASGKGGEVHLRPGNATIQAVFATLNPNLLPAKIDTLLAGHYHIWQQVDFSTDHPSQFIAGFSGTLEDIVPLPETLPPAATPAPGAKPNHFSSWVDGFGFMTMERRDATHWDVKVWNLAGHVVNTCEIAGRHSVCSVAQVH
jgi:hypothetical protein